MSVFFMDFDMAPSVIWARDLYDQMQIQSDFRKWFPRMCQYGFVEGRDYEFVPRVRPQDEGGRTVQRYVKDYRITLEMAKQLYVEPEVKEEPVQVIEEEEPTEEEKIPFTIAGNGEVEDNITDDSSKEFFTVKTKGGNTFFLVIDRARNSENVYMLSMIDEYDLQEFLTDEERNGKEEEEPAVVLPETKPEPEPDVEIEEPEQDDGKLTKILAIVFVLGVGGAGAFFYFYIYLKTANAFVQQYHRHHKPTRGHKFSIGVSDSGSLVGVAICGRPVARRLDDGYTLEINRLCTDGTPNACSILYAAAYRAARAMGYTKVVTYILDTESGVSLKAAGYVCEGRAGGLEWNGERKPKMANQYPYQMKTRWVKKIEKEGMNGR